MACKQIEIVEARLWIGHALEQRLAAGAVMLTNPKLKAKATEKSEVIKQKFKKDKEIEAD